MECKTDFQRDKRVGQIGETIVADHYSALGYEVEDVREDTYYQYHDDIDFFIDGIGVEVKTQTCL